MIEKILNITTPYGKIRASHEGSLHSSTLIFRNWTMQSGWVISRLAGSTNRASNYLHYICKRSSTSEQAIICFGVRTENKTHVLPARM